MRCFNRCVLWVMVFAGVWGAGAAAAQEQAEAKPSLSAVMRGDEGFVDKGLDVALYGEGAEAYWILEPKRRGDEPLPVVVFVHGLGQTHWVGYEAWIERLARRGNIVIYPRYHVGGIVDPRGFTAQAARGVRDALACCDGGRHARADTGRLTMIGHSLGGTIIANLAARPEHFGLPVPGALMLLQPGDTRADRGLGALFPSLIEDHGRIGQGTLMLIVDVEHDFYVSPKAGQRIYDNAVQVDPQDKRRLLMQTDAYGQPALVADHLLPMAWSSDPASRGGVSLYDVALWGWFDALQATAHGDVSQRERVFGEAALDLGRWPDGVPIRKPIDMNRGQKE